MFASSPGSHNSRALNRTLLRADSIVRALRNKKRGEMDGEGNTYRVSDLAHHFGTSDSVFTWRKIV